MTERELIAAIAAGFQGGAPGLLAGIGDDCAVIASGNDEALLVTVDTLVQGVHFDLGFHPPMLLGRKTVAVNVSDIGAMGGKPLYCLLSLTLPADYSESWVQHFFTGLGEACDHHGCLLIGGDTVRGETIHLSLTMIGTCKRQEVVYRRGAKIGDRIWISGRLGRSAAGLALLQQQKDGGQFAPLIEAHLDPTPRPKLGQALAQAGLVHAMMDLSDGLATDLAHLCARSEVAARIMADRLTPDPLLGQAAELLQRAPQDLMLFGGEDYELLFTAPAAGDAPILSLAQDLDVEVYTVGEIVAGQGVVLCQSGPGRVERPVDYGGFDHFSRLK